MTSTENKKKEVVLSAAVKQSIEDAKKLKWTGCGRCFVKGAASNDENTKKIFNDGVYGTLLKLNFKTAYCHHFTKEMSHCVGNKLGPETANKCHGILYGSIWSPSKLTCAAPRAEKARH